VAGRTLGIHPFHGGGDLCREAEDAAGQAAGGGEFLTVTVMPGQSLWSIAEDLAPAADPRDVVAAIVRLNTLADGAVSAGQMLAVPPEYDGR
jgi:Tfp pilus assembly protein FimV